MNKVEEMLRNMRLDLVKHIRETEEQLKQNKELLVDIDKDLKDRKKK